jgi:hypothetical protein
MTCSKVDQVRRDPVQQARRPLEGKVLVAAINEWP